MRPPIKIVLASALLLTGCAAGKTEPTDSFGDLQALDAKSDAFSSRLRIVGALKPGQTSPTVSYSKTPRYRGFQLTAKGPATVEINVRSPDGGDAVAWLLDSQYHVLAMNDDADGTTLDSHLVFDLPAGGASYFIVFRDYNSARHHFVVEVPPLRPIAPPCVVGVNIPDESQSVALGELEALFNSYLSSYQIYDIAEPSCLDWSDPTVQAAVAEDVRAHSGINWNDATPPVVQGAVKAGAADFLAALAQARVEVDNVAQSTLTKSANFQAYYPKVGVDQTAVAGDSATNADAYLELHLHVEAEECSQEGWVRIDTRSGEIVIVRVHGC